MAGLEPVMCHIANGLIKRLEAVVPHFASDPMATMHPIEPPGPRGEEK
jgi:hypothetical protein